MNRQLFKIIAWPRWSPSNTYTGSLNDALAALPAVQVQDLMKKQMLLNALTQRFDILHVHWFERAFWATSSRAVLRQTIYIAALALLLKVRGTRLVWTAHDPHPHASPLNRHLSEGWTRHLWSYYRRLLVSLVDGIILLSDS